MPMHGADDAGRARNGAILTAATLPDPRDRGPPHRTGSIGTAGGDLLPRLDGGPVLRPARSASCAPSPSGPAYGASGFPLGGDSVTQARDTELAISHGECR